jgi:DNA-binding NtrC family response regulator
MRLAAQQREFFGRIAAAAAANPFSEERARLELAITDKADAGNADPAFAERMATRIEDKLESLAKAGPFRLSAVANEDRHLLESALAFAAFYRFRTAFDDLISAQLEAGAEPVRVLFATDFFRWLERYKLPHEHALRLMALCYQLRRGFRFIAKGLVGRSAPMRRFRESLWNNLFSHDVRQYERLLFSRMEDFSTILVGETGTGKGQAAAALGRSGLIPFDDKNRCFALSFVALLVPINLSQYAESLIESELFGHQKGAFTGAVESHDGVFSRCNRYGTIFLDEIGEVSIPVQIKLLRVLQERTFSPVGSHKDLPFSGRVIAATHRSLLALRNAGRFRDDFYYRLCSDTIRIPSLRERLDDDRNELGDLVTDIVERTLGTKTAGLEVEITSLIDKGMGPDHPWPGNVRELEQCVRRVLLTGRCAPIAEATAVGAPAWIEKLTTGALTAEDLLTHYCTALYQQHGSYEKVARIAGLDRRTARKYVTPTT